VSKDPNCGGTDFGGPLGFVARGCSPSPSPPAPGPAPSGCNFRYPNHLHVYHIQAAGASSGVTEKNAASTFGERQFIFADGARGLNQYYDNGVIELVWASYTQTGPYAHCNHNGAGSYSCDNSSPYVGREQNSHSGGVWYSFNHRGENSQWHQRDCPTVRRSAKAVINRLAAAGGCGGCPSVACARCILGMSDATYKQIWDAEFGHPKELEMFNTSGAEDTEFGKPKALNASGVVLV